MKKEYYDNLVPNMEKYIKKCDELIALMEQEILDKAYNELSEGKQVMLAEAAYLPMSERIKKFEAMSYNTSLMPYEKTAEIYTAKGEQVRSKSEKIIADELYHRGIPYHYEKPLVLDNRGKQVAIFPDFTVMNVSTGKILYLEHLGMMDQPEYCQSAMRKLGLYERNGLLLGRDVIVLHESNSEPLNIRTLNQYIDEFLV
ncbi:MAG: hypothetical protein HUJ75_02680 [Parasporobacterium sp.]|nr:hypothetical protein [Parasporobacterium sp.]